MNKRVEFNVRTQPKEGDWESFKQALRPLLVCRKNQRDEYAVVIGVYQGFGGNPLTYLVLQNGQMPMWATDVSYLVPIRYLSADESVTIYGRGE